jgi:hypothetical protein
MGHHGIPGKKKGELVVVETGEDVHLPAINGHRVIKRDQAVFLI